MCLALVSNLILKCLLELYGCFMKLQAYFMPLFRRPRHLYVSEHVLQLENRIIVVLLGFNDSSCQIIFCVTQFV